MCGFAMPSRITCAVIATTFPNCFTVAHSVCCLMPWKPVWEASLLAGSTSLTGSGWRENEAVNRKEITEQATSLEDRKSTRLNSSHVRISYAVFCLKKKKKNNNQQ